MDQNLFATDPDLKKGFLAIANKRSKTERNKRRKRRKMPAKRKRSYSRRGSYKRRRYSPSASATAKALARLTKKIGPYGVDGSDTMISYGPSRQQMIDNPGWSRTPEQTQARLRDNYRGAGGYWQDLGRNIGHWGSRIGGAALGGLAGAEGGVPGMLLGAGTGWSAGSDFSKASGWGSYNVPRGHNDLFNPHFGNGSAPVYHSAGALDETGDVVIQNRELVKLVKSSSVAGEFKVESFSLNPVDSPTFHHLREQANQYENFEYEGLIFQYVPMTGEGGSNELGVVGMAASYDPAHTRQFTNMEHLMRFKGANTFKPSIGMVHGIECDPRKRSIKRMFVRDHITRDAQFTDPATFYIASEGCPNANQTLGQLWVSYTVRLSNIKMVDEVEANVNYNVFGHARSVPNFTASASDVIAGPAFVDTWLQLTAQAELTAVAKTFCTKVTNESDADHSILRIHFDKNKVQLGDRFMVVSTAGIQSSTGNWNDDTSLGFATSTRTMNDCEALTASDILYDNHTKYDGGTLEPTDGKIEENFDGAGADRIQSHSVAYIKITGVDNPYYDVKFTPTGGLDSGGVTNLQFNVKVTVTRLSLVSVNAV